jgi:predicted N-acetyltransferase YhbS
MPDLVVADGRLHEAILDQTFQLWHDELSRAAYGRYNLAQLRTAWGQGHLRRVALVEDGQILASAKDYSLSLWVDERRHQAVGIGAVFTPEDRRRRGYAQALIERMLGRASERGASIALLFSEIDPAYYEKLGFHRIPVTEVEITVRPFAGAPAMLVRSGETADLPFVAETQNRRAIGYRFALDYDAAWLQYSISKKRMLAGLASPGRRAIEFVVAEEGGRAVAWALVHVVGRHRPGLRESWSLEACGDRDPAGARIGAILQTLVARAPGDRPPLIRAWWPHDLAPPQLEITPRGPAHITMMARALAADMPLPGQLDAARVCYWHGDAF